MAKIDYSKVQAKRRKTLFPFGPRRIHRERMVIAAWLATNGYSIYQIRQVLNITPDMARTLVAKAKKRGLVN